MTNAEDIIREALREYVGDGDGEDQKVLAEYKAEVLREAAYALRLDEKAYGGNRAVISPNAGAEWLLRRADNLTPEDTDQ